MYATVQDLREEGVSEDQASDARCEALLREASANIERLTGWFFVPRDKTYVLDGRGVSTLPLPAPPITLSAVVVWGASLALGPAHLHVVGAPVDPSASGRLDPHVTRRHGRTFPRGRSNVVVEGRFGYTEPVPDGPSNAPGTSNSPSPSAQEGQTPRAIRRACVLWALRWLPAMGGAESLDARNQWRVIGERTRDQSYTLDRLGSESRAPFLSGDPDIDALLRPFVKPNAMGAV